MPAFLTEEPKGEPSEAQSRANLVRSTGLVGALTLVSRATGFLREVLLARSFGTSPDASALAVAQYVPNLSRAIVSEDIAQGALVQPLAEHLARGDEGSAWALARACAIWASVMLGVLTTGAFLFANALVRLASPGLDRAFADDAAQLLRLLTPIMLCLGVAGASAGYLVARRRFGAVGGATILSNLPIIAALLAAPALPIESVALLLVSGYVLQTAFVALCARRARGRSAESHGRVSRRELRSVGSLALPVMLSLGMGNLSGAMDISFSTLVSVGGPAALDKAGRLVFLPYGVIAVAVGIVALPALVEAARASAPRFDAELLHAFRVQAALLIPIAACMALLAPQLVRLAYARGEFDSASVDLTSNALRGIALALPALGLSLIGARAWLSLGRPWVPARVAVLGLLANGAGNALLVGPLGLFGIGLATAVAHTTVGLVLLLSVVSDRRRTVLHLASFTSRLLVVLGVAVLLGSCGWLASSGAPMIVRTALALAIGSLTLPAVARRLRFLEYEEIWKGLLSRGIPRRRDQ